MANRIEELLEARKLSKSELARRSGLHRISILRIASGESEPSLSNAIAIARALDSTVEEVFSTDAA